MNKHIKIMVLFLVIIFNSVNCFAMEYIEKVALMKQLCFHSVIISKTEQKEIFTANEADLSPLIDYLEVSDFKNAYTFNRVVGRSAAWLYVYGDAKYVYADTMTKSAVKIFKKNKIQYEYFNLVKEIPNTDATIYAFEKLTKNVRNSKNAYKLIYQTIYPNRCKQ